MHRWMRLAVTRVKASRPWRRWSVPRSKVSSGRRDEASLGVPDCANKQWKEGAAHVHGDRGGGSINRAALPAHPLCAALRPAVGPKIGFRAFSKIARGAACCGWCVRLPALARGRAGYGAACRPSGTSLCPYPMRDQRWRAVCRGKCTPCAMLQGVEPLLCQPFPILAPLLGVRPTRWGS